MLSEKHSAFIRGKIVAICEAILNEEIGVICGSRRLNALEFELHVGRTGWFEHDEDFIPFVAINSETDHLPVDAERKNWSIEALQRKDEEITKAESCYRDIAFIACKALIERFDIKDGT